MMRWKIPTSEVEQNLMMTEVCGATNCTMKEVGEAIKKTTVAPKIPRVVCLSIPVHSGTAAREDRLDLQS